MLKIYVPESYAQEKSYIIRVLFKEFLGVEYQLEINDHVQDYEITIDHKTLIIRDQFFNRFTDNDYLEQANIPDQVTYLSNQFTPEQDIPAIYGNDELAMSSNEIICGIDIFASSFFMLSRWEEYVNKTRDQHDRFPATASLAYKNNFLLRPVVNEYIEMLWNMLVALGYKGKRKGRNFEIKVSHDVDNPFRYYFKTVKMMVRPFASKLIKHGKVVESSKMTFQYYGSKINPEKYDPNYTFENIMDISDHHNLKSTFYFLTDSTDQKMDGDYDIFHPRMLKLLKRIDERGHEIGLHGSYNSYNDFPQYRKEWERLFIACKQAGVKQRPVGSRQHYLRWSTPKTWAILDQMNVQYDTTLAYADHAGFRCGVCYEYPAFDVIQRKQLGLIERPLVIMECSLLNEKYMGLTYGQAITYGKMLKDRVEKYSGMYTVLWHNDYFIKDWDLELYVSFLNHTYQGDSSGKS